jgi:hypothetical protein
MNNRRKETKVRGIGGITNFGNFKLGGRGNQLKITNYELGKF